MKNFVINNKGINRFWLTDEHVAWLVANGYPDAKHDFGSEDRSNPDLIACIEAVRASKQPLYDEANHLWRVACEIKVNNARINALLSAEIDKTLDMLDYRRYMKGRIIAEMRKVIESGNWMDANIYANVKPGVTISELKCQFGTVVDCFNLHRAEFQAEMDAFGEYYQYCQERNLSHNNGRFVIDDGFEIKSYDETRFVAAVGISYGDERFSDDHEFLRLKPFITEDTVASFVSASDTAGLMDYLTSLHLDLDIRRNPKPIDTTSTNNYDVTMTDEEFEQLLAGFGIIEGKAH